MGVTRSTHKINQKCQQGVGLGVEVRRPLGLRRCRLEGNIKMVKEKEDETFWVLCSLG
jgi:hypothetical protein